jgi:hypothetical protein
MTPNIPRIIRVGGSKHKEGADIDKSVEYQYGPCRYGFGSTITVSPDFSFLV